MSGTVGNFIYFLLCSRDDFRLSPIRLSYKACPKLALEKVDNNGMEALRMEIVKGPRQKAV